MSGYLMTMTDGKALMLERFLCREKEEGVLQIVHGASEHAGRYAHFASWFNEHGFSVYVLNNRGHGASQDARVNKVILEEMASEMMPEDVITVGESIKREHGESPFLLGHSMGSTIARIALSKKNPYKGAILSGSSWISPFQLGLIGNLVKLISLKIDSSSSSELLDNLVFISVRKDMEKRGIFSLGGDWLTTSDEEARRNREDEYLIQRWSVSAYSTLFKLIKKAQEKETFTNTNERLPMLFIGGADDGAIGYGKGMQKLIDKYRDHSSAKITSLLYRGMRHEVLADLNREKVYNDLYHFLKGFHEKD